MSCSLLHRKFWVAFLCFFETITARSIADDLSIYTDSPPSGVQLEKTFSDLSEPSSKNGILKAAYSLHNSDELTTICWNKKTTLHFYPNGTSHGYVQYSISMEMEQEPVNNDQNVSKTERYEIFENGSKEPQVLNFLTVKDDDQEVVKVNRTVTCKSDKVYVKTFTHLVKKRKVEIKLKPDFEDVKVDVAKISEVGPSFRTLTEGPDEVGGAETEKVNQRMVSSEEVDSVETKEEKPKVTSPNKDGSVSGRAAPDETITSSPTSEDTAARMKSESEESNKKPDETPGLVARRLLDDEIEAPKEQTKVQDSVSNAAPPDQDGSSFRLADDKQEKFDETLPISYHSVQNRILDAVPNYFVATSPSYEAKEEQCNEFYKGPESDGFNTIMEQNLQPSNQRVRCSTNGNVLVRLQMDFWDDAGKIDDYDKILTIDLNAPFQNVEPNGFDQSLLSLIRRYFNDVFNKHKLCEFLQTPYSFKNLYQQDHTGYEYNRQPSQKTYYPPDPATNFYVGGDQPYQQDHTGYVYNHQPYQQDHTGYNPQPNLQDHIGYLENPQPTQYTYYPLDQPTNFYVEGDGRYYTVPNNYQHEDVTFLRKFGTGIKTMVQNAVNKFRYH